jgi:hypothetical protein
MFRIALVMLVFLLAARGQAAAGPTEEPASSCIEALIDESAALALPARVERAFTLTLYAAHDALRDGDTTRAMILLRTFTFEVRGVKRAKRLRPESADMLIAKADEAIETLGRRDR